MRRGGFLVADLPLWPDHPWQNLIPPDIEVRRGSSSKFKDVAAFVRVDRTGEMRHVSFTDPEDLSEPQVRTALSCLDELKKPVDPRSVRKGAR